MSKLMKYTQILVLLGVVSIICACTVSKAVEAKPALAVIYGLTLNQKVYGFC